MKWGRVWSTQWLLTVFLMGCGQMYWTRSDSKATLDQFKADHRECLATTGVPVQGRPGFVVVTEQNLRTCLASRNWHREQWTSWEVPAGRFRGLEDFDPMTVHVETLPEQSPRATIDVNDPHYYIPMSR